MLAHGILGGAFFIILSIFSLHLFPKTGEGQPVSGRKFIRNFIYKVCGGIMLVCLLLMLIFSIPPFQDTPFQAYHPVFFLEMIALLAFGFSWFTKGGWFLPDEDPVLWSNLITFLTPGFPWLTKGQMIFPDGKDEAGDLSSGTVA